MIISPDSWHPGRHWLRLAFIRFRGQFPKGRYGVPPVRPTPGAGRVYSAGEWTLYRALPPSPPSS